MRPRVRKIDGVWCVDWKNVGISTEFWSEAIDIAIDWYHNGITLSRGEIVRF